MRHAKHSGFTLIELVIVIVILGILAAAALPRFSDLSTDARLAAINGLAGSIRSTASIAKATQLAKGYSVANAVILDGVAVNMSGGYPLASNISTALTDFSGFTLVAFGTSSYEFRLGGRTECKIRYTEAQGGGTGYTLTITSTGGDNC
jgi:MSHA pilin protein MshA